MQQLLSFFYGYRIALLFLFLQGLTFLLIYQNNRYQRLIWLSSTNQVTGSFLRFQSSLEDYTKLSKLNNRLVDENARLKEQIENLKAQTPIANLDSSRSGGFDFYPAKVIQNSTRFTQNLITIDRGYKHGIRPFMVVISDVGIVGRIKDVSENFATAYPLINTTYGVSVELKQGSSLFTTHWKSEDYRYIHLDNVTRATQIELGDTIVTSGEDAFFPKGFPVGVVREINREQTGFSLDVKVGLFVDFGKIEYVYVAQNQNKVEIDSLQRVSESEGI